VPVIRGNPIGSGALGDPADVCFARLAETSAMLQAIMMSNPVGLKPDRKVIRKGERF